MATFHVTTDILDDSKPLYVIVSGDKLLLHWCHYMSASETHVEFEYATKWTDVQDILCL